jgi:hypothetical protein
MFSISLQNIFLTVVFSIFVILSGHYLWIYLRDKYTDKKTKDLVNNQVEKYKKIVADLQESLEKSSQTASFLEEKDKDVMNEELEAFAKSIE